MARLTASSLEFAKRHIRHFYDSDFFPKSFEFDALWADWPQVVDRLVGSEIPDLPAPRPRFMAAPKPAGGYRIVHQLDPLAALIYTAMTHAVAPRLEAARVPTSDCVACAYRLQIDEAQGGFFGSSTGYQQFIERCEHLAAIHSHVLVCDVADFYNQVYLHRLQNVISNACPDAGSLANDIEDYLLALNGRASKGIPVGPAASIVMAEAVLNDVDQMIQGHGFTHTRYVDDIRIFADEPDQLDHLLRELTQYLYENHRLTLAGHKTKITPTANFVEEFLKSPDLQEVEETHEQLRAMTIADAYDVSDTAEAPTTASVIVAMMEKVCSRPRLDLGLARHILRKCRQQRIRAIVPSLFAHFSFFAPVMPAVGLYLREISTEKFVDLNVEAVATLYEQTSAKIPFVRMWLDDYVCRYPQYMNHPAIRAAVMSSPSFDARALGAITRRDVAWMRRHKGDVDSLGARDRRQLMRASAILAPDERRAWLRGVMRNHDSVVDRAVCLWLMRT